MQNRLAELLNRHKGHWTKQDIAVRSMVSILVLAFCGFVIQPFAVEYATEKASNPVTDIFLSNIPAYDVGIFFVYGMFLLIGVVTWLCFSHPHRMPFVLNSLSLFIVIRAVFVSLTHLAPYTIHAPDFGPAVTRAFYGADLFFSGHTGSPFLLALIFWNHTPLRYIFLGWSVFFGFIVLLGHHHYSIDVLAAFFITYTIYHIARWLFPKDYALFQNDPNKL